MLGSDWPGTTALGFPKSITQELLSTVSGNVGIPRILTSTSPSLVTLQAELAVRQMQSTVRIRYSWNSNIGPVTGFADANHSISRDGWTAAGINLMNTAAISIVARQRSSPTIWQSSACF